MLDADDLDADDDDAPDDGTEDPCDGCWDEED